MHFTDQQAVGVKAWLTKKLEAISDADSDVLADYVLALLRSDSPDREIRQQCVENLEDFLKEYTHKFVDELFQEYGKKPKAKAPTSPAHTAPISPTYSPSEAVLPIQAYEPLRGGDQQRNPHIQSRKRSFHEAYGFGSGQRYNGNARPAKTAKPRRVGREERHIGRDYFAQPSPQSSVFQQPFGNMPMPPTPSPGFQGIDPSDPMAPFFAMQAMLPAMAGMATASPADYRRSSAQLPPVRVKERCPDYDTKGFCVLGSSCPYEHGNAHIVANGGSDEYDPTNAIINTNALNGIHSHPQRKDFSRGRGRVRMSASGDRNGFISRAQTKASFSDPRYPEDRNFTTIVVEQIPEDYFEEEAIRDFFSQFGAVSEVTMKAYKHLAIVKYETHGSARRAWESPKVIFDNRFVKVYWYRPDLENTLNGSAAKLKSKIPSLHSSSPDTSMVDAPANAEEISRRQEEKQKVHEERRQTLQKFEEKRQDLLRQKEEVEAETANLRAQMAAKQGSRSVESGSADVDGHGVNGTKGAANGQVGKSKTLQALETQLAKLQAEAKSMGIDPNAPPEDTTYYSYRGGGRGGGYVPRGAYSSRGRGAFGAYDSTRGAYRDSTFTRGSPAVRKLDNRPRRVTVSGQHFDAKKVEAVKLYLMNLVEYERVDFDAEKPESVIVAFRERWQAEQLMKGRTEIPGIGKVVFSWLANAPVVLEGETLPEATGGKEQAGHEETHHEIQEENLDVAEDDGWS